MAKAVPFTNSLHCIINDKETGNVADAATISN